MAKINLMRVVLGGLLAGVVLNVLHFVLNEPILGDQWAVATESLGRGVPEGAGVMIRVHHVGYITWNFLIWNFLMGIALVWFYAAVRPRFGPGPKTAVFAGLAVWFVVWFLGFGGTLLAGMIPTNAVVITLIWGVFQVPIATVAGAWLYQEGGAPVPAAPEVQASADSGASV